ncbi:hypothetical protein DQ384_26095 [Sphaerisporangium album]|uniref:Uncharacterized protein n=1 Tax=Sphaerisporangium album TaxID=509200 RepID=A0A367FA18_9ACTN|nr:hypothetical protein [Sphaerisporangium album]RCG27194.1 hypothetical protein DQ384_26095 [Sphaerisporangium album]
MADRPRPEHRQPDESTAGHITRAMPWYTMQRCCLHLERLRGSMTEALRALDGHLAGMPGSQNPAEAPVPDSQRDRVTTWAAILCRQLAELDQLDLESWKSQVRAEILPTTAKDRP